MNVKRILIILVTLCSAFPLSAQEEDAPYWDYTVLSGGVGAGLASTAINLKLQNGFMFGGMQRKSSSPVYAGAFEKRLNKNFGIGAAYSYQTIEMQSSNFNFFGTAPEINIDTYTRSNYAIRGLLFMGNSKKLDMYFAMRLGYTMWQHTSTSSSEEYINSRKMTDSPSMQLAYGMRYFFGKLGIGYEVAIGTAPYLVLANVCIKFD